MLQISAYAETGLWIRRFVMSQTQTGQAARISKRRKKAG